MKLECKLLGQLYEVDAIANSLALFRSLVAVASLMRRPPTYEDWTRTMAQCAAR